MTALRSRLRPRTRLRSLTAAVRGRHDDAAPGAAEVAALIAAEHPDAGELDIEPTNLGPLMDAVVARSKWNERPPGDNADYELVRANFDYVNFLLTASGHREVPDKDLIALTLRRGSALRHSPDINFSTSAYLERHPERGEGRVSPYLQWLKHGRAAGEIADPVSGVERIAPMLGLEEPELIEMLAAKRTDYQQRLRTGRLGEMFARAAQIEPLIGDVWPETTHPRLQPLGAPPAIAQMVALHDAQQDAGFARARLVLVINRPRWGGGRRAEGHIAHALAAHVDPSEIVVVYTDSTGETPRGRFPEGVREVDLATHTAGLGDAPTQQTLVALLRSFEAEAIVNINSRVLYHAMRPYGRALAASERMFLMFFCNEQHAMGNWSGWSQRYLYRTLDLVRGVFTDSEFMRDSLIEGYQLGGDDADRMHVLHAPVDPSIPVAPRPAATEGRRPTVFWAGRWDRQKRVDLVLAVARRMPDVDFRLWGEPVLQGGAVPDVPDNVELRAPYANFTDLDLSAADAWLYTSAWDGVPSLLLEVAMTGVPLVGSLIGGTGEVIGEQDAWPVADIDDVAAYESALRDILADPDKARARAAGLRERMIEERPRDSFGDFVTNVLLPNAPAEEPAR